MDYSSFSEQQYDFSTAKRLSVSGSTCDCYQVKLYGKLHFLKRLKVEMRTDPRFLAALRKEFETGYQLEHPNLVRYLSCGEDYILTEYVDGETLDDFIVSHPDYFTHRENGDRFVQQLLSVMDFLHQHQVVHLDLKPSNIMITRVCHEVKLIDLGYCYTDSFSDTMGHTAKYAAPEQLDGSEKVDARTDIYAIGRILQILPCAHYYKKVISKCTAPRPANRYQTVAEIVHDTRRRVFPQWSIAVFSLLVLVAFLTYHFASEKDADSTELLHPADSTGQTYASPTSSMPITELSIRSEESMTTVEPIGQQIVPPIVPANNNPDASPAIEQQEKSVEQVKTSEQSKDVETEKAVVHEKEFGTVMTEDTLALRQLLKEALRPLYLKHLAKYERVAYDEMNQEQLDHFGKSDVDFEMDAFAVRQQVLASNKNRFSRPLFDNEWQQALLYYKLTLFWKMKRNSPNHDPFYDNKKFRYYEYAND